MLREALDVIEAWGFSYKTVAFNWVKQNRNGTQQEAPKLLKLVQHG